VERHETGFDSPLPGEEPFEKGLPGLRGDSKGATQGSQEEIVEAGCAPTSTNIARSGLVDLTPEA
jgi:hypothetical protein